MDYRLEQLRFELREDPSSRSFLKLGECLRREGEFDEAIEVLRAGLKIHGDYVAAWVCLGRAQLESNDAKGAQESLEQSLQIDPENVVAAKLMGEAAIVNGEWVTAVKALKRARGLSPQDDALDERISFVEEHLADLGLLEEPSPEAADRTEEPAENDLNEAEAAGEDPFAVRSGDDSGVWDEAGDVFAAGRREDSGDAEDGRAETGDSDTWPEAIVPATEDFDAYGEPLPLTDDDLASMVDDEDSPETAEPAVAVDEEEPAMNEESGVPAAAFIAPEPEAEPEPETEPEPDSVPETVGEAESAHDFEHEPEPAAAPESELEKNADGISLPTMTLARLALDQGDLDLAERTVRGVLEKEPGHPEAAELLETLVAGPPEQDTSAKPKDPSDARAEALQRWLDAVRLASERLKT